MLQIMDQEQISTIVGEIFSELFGVDGEWCTICIDGLYMLYGPRVMHLEDVLKRPAFLWLGRDWV